jgi:hypothetical protein
MGKMKSLLNFFVEIEPDEDDEVPEEAASEDVDEAARAAVERAEQGEVGRRPEKRKRVREMVEDPYAGEVDEEALASAAEVINTTEDRALFDRIYRAASLPAQGAGVFTIHKVQRLLASKHLEGMSDQVKRSSVLVTLESSNASLEDVIGDAVARDKALDQYDAMLRRDVRNLEASVREENAAIESEMQEYLQRKKKQIEDNRARVDEARRMYEEWSGKKEREEDRLFQSVSIFTDADPGLDNEISRGASSVDASDSSSFSGVGDIADVGGGAAAASASAPEAREPAGDADEEGMSADDQKLSDEIEALEDDLS